MTVIFTQIRRRAKERDDAKWISVPVYGADPAFTANSPRTPWPGSHDPHSVDHVSALFEGYFLFYFCRRLRVAPLDRHENEPKLGPHRPWATEPSKTGFFIGPEPCAPISFSSPIRVLTIALKPRKATLSVDVDGKRRIVVNGDKGHRHKSREPETLALAPVGT